MRRTKYTFYSYDFKCSAVAVANHTDIQTKDVAEALDIHPFMLARWKREMRDGVLKDNNRKTQAVTDLSEAKLRIRQLEKELKQVRNENSVLKKAERIFPGKK